MGAPSETQRATLGGLDGATRNPLPAEPNNKYLVIVDDRLAAAIQPLVDLKRAQGFTRR